jgi:hypothetical protein
MCFKDSCAPSDELISLKPGKYEGPNHQEQIKFLRLNSTNKNKAIPVTDCDSPQACETSRLPCFLDNWLTDSDDVVSLTRRLVAFYLQEDSWYSFLLEAESTPGP